MVRQSHFINPRILLAGVRAILIGCTFLLVVGCAGTRSEAPQEEQGHTEATEEQTHSDRCEGTQTVYDVEGRTYTSNDVFGCPNKGGLLSGTDRQDKLDGEDGDDEIRGLGAIDWIYGGSGSDVIYGGDGDDWMLVGGGGEDVIYGGDGDDSMLVGGGGEDVIYGGDGNDRIDGATVDQSGHVVRKQRDKLYCGEGKDKYIADKLDNVSSSCELKLPPPNM